MSNSGKIKPKQTDAIRTVSNLIDEREIYNLNPPYQRENVWPTEWKSILLTSIFDGLPLAPITLVEKENDNGEQEFILLDGKQRIMSLFDFIDDKVKAELDLGGSIEKLTYSEIKARSKDKKDPQYTYLQKYFSDFRNYNFKAVIYPDIDWADQIKLFDQINHSKELSKFDRYNARLIFAKYFTNFFFETYIPMCDKYVKNSKATNGLTTSGKDLFWKFLLLGAIMGQNINLPTVDVSKLPKPEVDKVTKGKKGKKTSTGTSTFSNFIQQLDSKISEYMTKNDDKYLFNKGNKSRVEDMIKEFDWKNLIENAEFFNKIFELFESLDKDKKKYHYVIIYFAFSLLEKFQEKKLTHNMLVKESDAIIAIYDKYYAWAAADKERTRRAGDQGVQIGSRKDHLDKIRELFAQSTIDFGLKYRSFTKEEKEKIRKDAGDKCEICGSTQNLEYDHVNPASLSSDKIGGLLCERHNRMKADNTGDDMKLIQDYTSKKLAAKGSQAA